MDLHLFEEDEIPRPRAELRIEQLDVEPYPDGQRIKVRLAVLPFSERPNLDILVLDPHGRLMTTLSVIEVIDRKMDFTLHLRQPEPGDGYGVRVVLFYPPPVQERDANPEAPDQIVDTREAPFAVPASPDEDDAG
jgi:hypothetical protein